MSLETLRSPHLWLPKGPAERIFSLCSERKKRIDAHDKASTQPHYRHLEVPAASAGVGAVATIGSAAESALPVGHHKADARREYDQEIIRKKKAAKEAAALLRSGKGPKKSAGRKQHSEELTRKIEALKMYVKDSLKLLLWSFIVETVRYINIQTMCAGSGGELF